MITVWGFQVEVLNLSLATYTRQDKNVNTVILGINIGKNKNTSNEEGRPGLCLSSRDFFPTGRLPYGKYQSPNTVGLRRLQDREYLEGLLTQLTAARAKLDCKVPVLVKIAPDLKDDELDDVLDAVTRTEMDGIIATNTTISRENLISYAGNEIGGLSGAPLKSKSREMVSKIYQRTGGKLPIVGVGGIITPDDAKAMLDAGAVLVQLYSGLIYAGPHLVIDILDFHPDIFHPHIPTLSRRFPKTQISTISNF